MNRLLLTIYLVSVPIIALTTLYELGSVHLQSGFPFVWVDCLLILGLPNYGQCGYYLDWFALLLDVVFYTGWGYGLLGCWVLLGGGRSHPPPS
jgi:hypothetical protein